MKCLCCKKEQAHRVWSEPSQKWFDFCPYCHWVGNWRDPIDPAVLLDLVEKASRGECTPHVILGGITSYLSGDPSALLRLAGVKE
jgi:hypothetical protein